MKYRRLDTPELEALKDEFVQFLVSNTITVDDWQNLKEKHPGQAEGLIDIFSDIVMEKALKKVDYLTHVSSRHIKLYWCQKETVHLIGIELPVEAKVEFSPEMSAQELLSILAKNKETINIYRSNKAYQEGDREQEIFQMMQKGALIDNQDLYERFM